MFSQTFDELFRKVTGLPGPLSWQQRLYAEFLDNTVRPVLDLPTGMGKTAVIPIWLIARAHQIEGKYSSRLPTRLVYVVDRRTVVDQATEFAERINKALKDEPDLLGMPVTVSTLRGQLADNREWSTDLSRPAIIIGTVDLIGSALLFSGYRSTYKRRPLEAGLLGQDSLLVLDEAHLSKPFEKLVTSISAFQAGQGAPMRVMSMSATTGSQDDERFSLLPADLDSRTENGEEKNAIFQRFTARKQLIIEPPVEKKLINASMCKTAIHLAKDNSRVVVFVRSPDNATKIASMIRAHGSTKGKTGPFGDSVAVLTGTMRGLERDQMLEHPAHGSTAPIDMIRRVMRRFLDPDNRSDDGPAILVSTSAGEVGFDLNADHMVCDAAPLDSMVQRLGRVNRRGKGNAVVRVFVEKEPKLDRPFENASARTMELLKDQTDVSPKALANLKSMLTFEQLESACMPEPTTVELTDVLLDAWSMTTVVEPMPGRPEVGPWLRGVAEDLPHTTIAWRAELDEPGFGDLELEEIEDWFDVHRVLTHETLSVVTSSRSEDSAEKWLKARWERLGRTIAEERQREIGARPVIIYRAGLQVMPLADLVAELSRGNSSSIRNAHMVLPASFGGIERGLLDADAPKQREDENDADSRTIEENARERLISLDVADIAPQCPRCREVITSNDGDTEQRVIGGGRMPAKPVAFRCDLESDDTRRVQLVSYIPRSEKLEYNSEEQTLRQHVDAVRRNVDPIFEQFSMLDVIKRAAELAADFHDHGKNRERWQRTIGGKASPAGQNWLDTTLGKSGGYMKRDPRGYRHEFGSLYELADETRGKISDDVFDLAMHLIAVHHGRGRPHFPKGGFDPDAEQTSEAIHSEAIRRFARLQRKYGWWQLAWLENLLRCADAMASAQLNGHKDREDKGKAVSDE